MKPPTPRNQVPLSPIVGNMAFGLAQSPHFWVQADMEFDHAFKVDQEVENTMVYISKAES
jgi:hypothetical protein